MHRPKEKTTTHRSHRIWIIIALILFVLTFSSYIASSSSHSDPYSRKPYSNAHLKAKNYLNSTEAGPDPFPFCPVYGSGDKIAEKYGHAILSRSQIHPGSGARVQRLINRALAGQPVTISIIGGSVSACHGAGDDPISLRGYPSRFFQWWNSVFPHPATELTNGAMRRTNSAYFGYCNAHHLPDVTDLVIIELDTDDDDDEDTTTNFEILVRSILIRPDQPAVLILGHFSPQIYQAYRLSSPDYTHNAVAQYYDIPHISTKPLLLPKFTDDPQSIDDYFADPVLASPKGHALITDFLISYFQSQICTAWSIATGRSYEEQQQQNKKETPENRWLFGGIGQGQRKGVPELGLEDTALDADGNRIKPDPATTIHHYPSIRVPSTRMSAGQHLADPAALREIAPFCVSANDLINPLPTSLFFGSGWSAYHPKTTGTSAASQDTTAHYWHSTLPLSKLRIPIMVGAGEIAVYYVREPRRVVGEGSTVECWVDDNYSGAKTIGNAAEVEESKATLAVIDEGVAEGSHFVECVLLGEEGKGVSMFKIIGVFAT